MPPICTLVQVSGGLHFLSVCFVLLQVAAVYRDPSVGNLINIMIVKLVIIHNEQVSVRVCTQVSHMADVSAGVPGPACSLRGLFERTLPALSVSSLRRKQMIL